MMRSIPEYVAAQNEANVERLACEVQALKQKRVIKISKRADDYRACIDGKPEYWGCGPSVSAAVGHLVIAHLEQFGAVIDWWD